ncbi:hypothetical protein C2S51_010412 [Perilla frutescens var. frutescens]|nr:hypothetical protein C2S51_010412 [Perilla frutescens var. frutescens]
MEIDIVDIFHVSPSQGAPSQLLLPLLHSDMIWLPSHITKTLFFYDFEHECSKSFFLNDIVPNLKNSLSLTLKHFPPLVGKIVVPLSSGMPVSRYMAGDTVALTIALSDADFSRLTGDDHFMDVVDIHDLVPQMPPPNFSPRLIEIPVAAIQITLFPDKGISVGFNIHHAVCDGTMRFRFHHAWASISKFHGGDGHLVALGDKFLPFYDRSLVQDGDRLAAKCWKQMKMGSWPTSPPSTSPIPTTVQAKFVLTEAVLTKLKSFDLRGKLAVATGISSFVAVSAYVWSCVAKSAAAAGETVADDEPEYFAFSADCRAKLSPPLPDTYFGNCLTLVLTQSTHGTLKGKGGFAAAAETITEAVGKVVDGDWGNLEGSENVLNEIDNLGGKRITVVGGSPKFDVYGVDFGWGKPKMFKFIATQSVFISKSRDGGVEIGMSMPKVQMEVFAANFNQGLREVENLHVRSSL